MWRWRLRQRRALRHLPLSARWQQRDVPQPWQLEFEDTATATGTACPSQFSSGATFADVDGDRDLDLFVTAMGQPNRLFRNDGNGKFTDITTARIGTLRQQPLALADIDGDAI